MQINGFMMTISDFSYHLTEHNTWKLNVESGVSTVMPGHLSTWTDFWQEGLDNRKMAYKEDKWFYPTM
jgi:hypothetical protein